MEMAIVIVVVLVLIGWYQNAKKQRRLAYLRQKYGDEDIVQKIYAGYFWMDQSEDQLIESLGRPVSVDKKVLKTKTREVWKYNHQGANRYGLRITLENGFVAGWDKKD